MLDTLARGLILEAEPTGLPPCEQLNDLAVV